ncbi:MAG: hypothetical protein HFE74_08425 [Firmicutes bacterium]|jgi:hypothetical protein|nr:hypothetical protein [Bacillota bacterium]
MINIVAGGSAYFVYNNYYFYVKSEEMNKKDYLLSAFNNLNTIYEIGKKITPISQPYTKKAGALRTLQLENMVEKVLLHDKSMIHCFQIVNENLNELDTSIIASAARNIMEISNIYFHISERKIGEDEIQLRYDTMYLNAMINLQDIYKKLDFSSECFHARIEKDSLISTREEVKHNHAFQQKEKIVQDQILSGRKIIVKANPHNILEKSMESAIYNLLSNSVHSLFIGLGSNSLNNNFFYSNFFTATRLLTISLQVAVIYTAYIIKDYLELRKQLYKELNDEEKSIIKNLKSDVDLKLFLNDLKKEFENSFFDNPLG